MLLVAGEMSCESCSFERRCGDLRLLLLLLGVDIFILSAGSFVVLTGFDSKNCNYYRYVGKD